MLLHFIVTQVDGSELLIKGNSSTQRWVMVSTKPSGYAKHADQAYTYLPGLDLQCANDSV